MKKQLNLIIMTLLAVVTLVSCSDSVTYADMKKKERNAINRYISNQKIQKISEAKFEEQGFTTDTTKNEYVLFESNGVYMQIVRKGEGASLKPGETATVLCRFKEYNILEGDSALQLTNILQYNWLVDKMTVKNTSGTFTASFISGESLMYTKYSSQAVPSGWLGSLPCAYCPIIPVLKIGRSSPSVGWKVNMLSSFSAKRAFPPASAMSPSMSCCTDQK